MELIAVVVVIFSIILHEVAHGYVANWLGDPTAKYAGRLTLNPVPHIDMVGSIIVPGLALLSGSPFMLGWAKPVPVNPYNLRYGKWGEALTALAGPGTNIAIAAIAGLAVRFGGPAFATTEMLSFVLTVIIANISLAVLNMLPIPPLDGSKVVAAFLPPGLYMQYRELENLTYALGPFGLILVLILIVNFLSAPMGILTYTIFSVLTGVPI
jgi:Zn-dependent protease